MIDLDSSDVRYPEIDRLKKQLRLRESLSEAVTSYVEPERLLPSVLEILVEGFDAEGGAIYYKDRDDDSISVKATMGLDPGYMKRFRKIEMGTHVTGIVAQTGKALLVNDSQSDGRATEDVVKILNYRSAMATPVTSEDRVVGIIALIHKVPNSFNQRDLDLLESVGGHLSPAIVNSFLNQEISIERRKIHEILESAEEGVFEALVERTIPADDNVTMMVKRFLNEARFTLVNSSFEKQMGNGPLLNVDVKEGFSPDTLERFLRRAFRKGHMEDVERREAEDSVLMYEVSIILVNSDDGGIKGIRGTRRDISKRIEMEESLKRSKHNTELYLDILLHDISNINTVSSGFLELMMLRQDLTERSQDYLKYCLEAVKRATNLINKVRTLSHIDSESQDMMRYDLISLFDAILEQTRQEYPNKVITVHKTLSVSRAEIMAGDLIKDMFRHIIANSIVHNPNKGVDIWFEIGPHVRQGYDGYLMTISDNGPGIPEIMKENVFDRSKRQDGNLPGSGLGLSIVKGIVERYHGQIWVEDRIKGSHGMGSSFRVFLRKE